MKTLFGLFLVVFLVGCSNSSSEGFKGYSFTTPTAAITFSMMGVASDGSARAGADPAAMVTPSGQVRLFFTGEGGNMKSATSSDGTTFTLDTSFTSPFPLVGIAEQTIVASPTGGYRMFARQDGLVYSATSTDGAVWTQESGTRFNASSIPISTITGPTVVRLSNGQYRMYFSPEPTNCASGASTAHIYSAISSDQLTWTAETGERIGNSVDTRCKNKPSAVAEADGSFTLFYHVYSLTGSGETYLGMVFYANSTDGSTFTSQTSTGLGLTTATSGGLTSASDAAVVRLPDGSLRLYFDVFLGPNGDQIYVSTGTKQ